MRLIITLWLVAAAAFLGEDRAIDVLTSRNNLARTGVNADERTPRPRTATHARSASSGPLYADAIVFTRGASLLAGINQRGEPVHAWVQARWRGTEPHDYSGHAPNARTNADGWIELRTPAHSYVTMAPLR